MSAEDFRTRPIGAQPIDDLSIERSVVSAIFDDTQSAQAAITELRQMGIPAEDISLVSRNEDKASATSTADVVGVIGEPAGKESAAYSASLEPSNNEDLQVVHEQTSASDTPVVFEYEVPPDEPLGGSRQLGLDPDSSAAGDTLEASTEQMAVELGQERVGSAVVGAGLGSVAGLLAGIAALAVPGVGPILAAGPLATVLGGMLAGGAVGGIIGALATVGVPEEYAREYAASIEQGSTLVSVHTDALARDAVERVLVAHGGRDVH
jgi:uncharacterized membrane protein